MMGKKAKGKDKKKKAADKEIEEPVGNAPPGITPIFVTEKGLNRHGMKTGPNIDDCVPYKLLPKEIVDKELQDLGFMSDFYVIRDKIKKYDGEEMLMIFDEDSVYEQNFFWCSSPATFEEYKQKYFPDEGAAAGGVGGVAVDKEEEERLRLEKEKEEAAEKKLLTYVEKAIVARPWEDLGTLKELKNKKVIDSRPLRKLHIHRVRRDFSKLLPAS
eukprot:918334_1